MLGGGEQADLTAHRTGVGGEGAAVELDRTRGGRDQSSEQLEQCGLTGAVGAKQGDELAGCYRQVDMAQCPEIAIGFGELIDDEAQDSIR